MDMHTKINYFKDVFDLHFENGFYSYVLDESSKVGGEHKRNFYQSISLAFSLGWKNNEISKMINDLISSNNTEGMSSFFRFLKKQLSHKEDLGLLQDTKSLVLLVSNNNAIEKDQGDKVLGEALLLTDNFVSITDDAEKKVLIEASKKADCSRITSELVKSLNKVIEVDGKFAAELFLNFSEKVYIGYEDELLIELVEKIYKHGHNSFANQITEVFGKRGLYEKFFDLYKLNNESDFQHYVYICSYIDTLEFSESEKKTQALI